MVRRTRKSEAGQAALVMVVLLTAVLSIGAGLMANDVIQHDPIIQTDTVDHFAYRALEAGINTFMSDANANPNELTCSTASSPGGQCTPNDFREWKRVGNTNGTEVVPEYYAWGNPRFCFSHSCTATASHTKPILYVKETIYGAAGVTGHYSYEQSTINLSPVNGFLTRIWWSTYEASDPALATTNLTPTSPTPAQRPKCTYNWNQTPRRGPNTTAANPKCGAVVFAAGTQVYGPIYSNDSIYIEGGLPKLKLGPVETHDPDCLFVVGTGTTQTCVTKTAQAALTPAARTVTQGATTFNESASGVQKEPLPKTDSTLQAFAAFDGCVYTGPTTIHFDRNDKMTVWSKDTPAKKATATKNTPECPSTHLVTTKTAPSTLHTSLVPNGANGNGVIYVKTATSSLCSTGGAPGANPFDDYTKTNKVNGTDAQYALTGGTYYYDYFGHQAYPYTNCEADAFVSDNPTTAGSPGGVQGQLTIATRNDVVITGTIKYTDCGTGFASTVNHPCSFNSTGLRTNDSLGLIAQNYIVVNHPIAATKCGGTPSVCKVPKATSGATLDPTCTTANAATPTTAALCNPVADNTGSTLTIDGALLSLNHSFTVDNEGVGTPNRGCIGVGALDGTLKVYGSIDQKWRGVVGCVGNSGYVKDYDWNSIGSVVTPPHYLDPATASWAVGSSAVNTTKGEPSFGQPTPTRDT
jgi:hypothetical protein